MSCSVARSDASSQYVTPSATKRGEAVQEVQLSVVVVYRKVRKAQLQYAASQGTTAGYDVLRRLRDVGIAEVGDADLIDRLSTPNTVRKPTVGTRRLDTGLPGCR